jgi:trk system potassium uptake protein TrkA
VQMIVVGCGRVGSELAYRLYEHGHEVTVLDADGRSFANLPVDFRGRTVEGDVLTREVLRRARLDAAEGLAAVTSCDSVNTVVAVVGRVMYNVPTVVVRNYDPRFAALQEAIGVDTVGATNWAARRLEELLSESGAHSVFSAGTGQVRLYEFMVPTRLAGTSLEDLTADTDARIVALTRDGIARMPDAEETVEAGDVVHVASTPSGMAALQGRLSGEED